MKNYLFIFVILMLSCKEQNHSTKNNNYNEISPLFLTLSPQMDENYFQKELARLNDSGTLINNKFLLKLEDNEIIDFIITKESESINLNYNLWEDYYDLNSEKRDKIRGRFQMIIEGILKIYSAKYQTLKYVPLPISNFAVGKKIYYDYNNSEIINPLERKSFRNYGLNRQENNFFQDSTKTIVVGYDITHKIIRNGYEKFGLDLEIYYFDNTDFKKITNSIIKDSIEFDNAIKDFISLRKNQND